MNNQQADYLVRICIANGAPPHLYQQLVQRYRNRGFYLDSHELSQGHNGAGLKVPSREHLQVSNQDSYEDNYQMGRLHNK